MTGSFELFVAGRYLRARRKEKIISVITVISVVGVMSGVMALVISLAVNNGFQNTLQRNMLAATAHVNIVEKNPGTGIADWRNLIPKLRAVPHVIAVAPVLYDQVFLSGQVSSKLVTLKGIDASGELATSDTLRHLKSGSLAQLNGDDGLPGVILGVKLVQDAGLRLNSVVTIISPQGTLTPFGPEPRTQRFRLIGIFETDFFDVDDYLGIRIDRGGAETAIERRRGQHDRNAARQSGPRAGSGAGRGAYRGAGITVRSPGRNRTSSFLHALKLERAVTAVTIGLITLVAALNILITLTMIVLTKYKDIAVLMSMGARRRQVRRIFILQGAIIGADWYVGRARRRIHLLSPRG